jgi:hypothetical protein
MNFAGGGKVGDFINSLYVVSRLAEAPADLFITGCYGGDPFSRGVEASYSDLVELVAKQPYIKSFNISGTISEEFINLNAWRLGDKLYKANWTEIFDTMYGLPRQEKFTPYLHVEADERFKDYIVIHRSTQRHTNNFPWEDIIKNNNVVFVGFDKNEINTLPNASLIEYYAPKNFHEYACIIKGAKGFIGNQSSPLTLAYGVGQRIFAELHSIDSIHYFYNKPFRENFFYISDTGAFSIEGLDAFVKI